MNTARALSVHRLAWSLLSGAVFLWLLAFLWDWPMARLLRLAALLAAAGAAVVVGWVLQGLWGFAIPILCRASQQQSTSLKWLLVAGMALAAPALADSLHTLAVVCGGIRFYNAELSRISDAAYWIFLGVRGGLTFFLLWPFVKVPLRHRTMWVCCVVLWTWLDFKSEVAFK